MASEPLEVARERWRASRNGYFFSGARKEKPGGGNAGSDLFVIGVYGFKYAAWLLFLTLESVERIYFSFQPIFFSCSSLFLFFCNVPKFNRTLCEFASFSVCLRTHSSLGGDDQYEQDACQRKISIGNHGLTVPTAESPCELDCVL